VTHTYIQAIKQPTFGYLTRSVRRRVATSKRRNRTCTYPYAIFRSDPGHTVTIRRFSG
jgi:hypothetical protein